MTTGTFAPMCSSGAYFNMGHTNPRIKLGGGEVTLNDVPAYAGSCGGGHLPGRHGHSGRRPEQQGVPGRVPLRRGACDRGLVAGKDVRLVATAYGTDCYPETGDLDPPGRHEPGRSLQHRNCYQNYNVAVNLSDRVIYTYMGVLQPQMRNANYCSAGQLSPLLNDPLYFAPSVWARASFWEAGRIRGDNGTQHNPWVPRTEKGSPKEGAGTLAVTWDLKQMSPEMAPRRLLHRIRGHAGDGHRDTHPDPGRGDPGVHGGDRRDIRAPVVDYSEAYPNRTADIWAK